jgi:ATP-dependent RNA helicase DOB1
MTAGTSRAGGKTGGKGGAGKGKTAVDPVKLIKCRAMQEPFEALRELARRVGSVVEEARLPIDVAAYVDKLSTDLVDVVVEWCGGAKFADVVKICEWYAGSIMRPRSRLA